MIFFFENEENSLSVCEEPDLIMLGRLADASGIEIIADFAGPIEVTMCR